MKEEIIRKLVLMVCDGFADTIMTCIEEQKEKLPYLMACSNFIYELRKQNIQVEFNNMFTDITLDKIFRETSNYLAD